MVRADLLKQRTYARLSLVPPRLYSSAHFGPLAFATGRSKYIGPLPKSSHSEMVPLCIILFSTFSSCATTAARVYLYYSTHSVAQSGCQCGIAVHMIGQLCESHGAVGVYL